MCIGVFASIKKSETAKLITNVLADVRSARFLQKKKQNGEKEWAKQIIESVSIQN